MDTYSVRGLHNSTGNTSLVKTVYCYQKQACIAPATGNFDLNQTCTYTNVPLFVDKNFNIQSSGRSIHHGSDINFFSNQSHFLNIRNGGRIDLNRSTVFAGLSNPSSFFGFGLLSILSFFVLFFIRPFLSSKEVVA